MCVMMGNELIVGVLCIIAVEMESVHLWMEHVCVQLTGLVVHVTRQFMIKDCLHHGEL